MNSPEEQTIRIAITGPESTGKSTLSQKLAAHYKTIWVPEYAREYLDQLNRPYRQSDLVDIAKGQISMENKALSKASRLLICDTELTVVKIWSQSKYGNVDNFILEKQREQSYDAYLLMDIDLPWEYDPQRENPDKRKYFFDWFERELKASKIHYKVISGNHGQRFAKACDIIDQLLYL